MRTFPSRIRARLPPEILTLGTCTEAVGATVVSTRFISDVNAAAHARLGGNIAWLVSLVLGGEGCYVGAVGIVACC